MRHYILVNVTGNVRGYLRDHPTEFRGVRTCRDYSLLRTAQTSNRDQLHRLCDLADIPH
jgi:hypothetical protein